MSKEEKKKLQPRLRFPEFLEEDPWVQKEVSEVFKVTRGEVLSMNLVKELPSSEFPYPVYSSQTKNNGLAGFYKDYLFEDAITWTTDGANAGDVNFREGKFYCTNVCGVLISNNGQANVCVASLINSVSKNYVSYVGNPKLMNGVMSKIPIAFPSLAEQQKIADCLFSLDELMAAQSSKLEALKAHKKGLMQALFPAEGETVPKLRFPEFSESGEWVEKALGSIAEVVTGNTPSTKELDNYGGENLFVSPADISDTRYVVDTKTRISNKGFSQTRQIKANSVLFVCIGSTIGKVAQNKIACATNQQLNSLMPFSDFSSDFLYSSLENRALSIANLAGKQAVPIVNKSLFSSVLIPVPSLQEQQKIANCLSSLDALIVTQTEKLEALKLHKKGLMQGLFPATGNTIETS